MSKKLTLLIVPAALAVALTGVVFLSPASATHSERGQCQQDCTRTYQECRGATNANQAACKQAFDACRERCKDVRGNTNANGNTNGNTNTNTNTNGNTNSNSNNNNSSVRLGR